MEFLPPPIEGYPPPSPPKEKYRTHDWTVDDTDVLVCLTVFGPFYKIPVVPKKTPHILRRQFDWDKIAAAFNRVTKHDLTSSALKSRMGALRDPENRSAKHRDRLSMWEAKRRTDPEVLVILTQAGLDVDMLGMLEGAESVDADDAIGEGTLVESVENPEESADVGEGPSERRVVEPADAKATESRKEVQEASMEDD